MAFIISENVRQEVGTISYSRTLFSSAAVTLLIIAILSGTRLMGFSAFEYAGLIMLGIVPTLLGHGSMYYAIRYVSPTVVASTPMGEPVLASIMGWFLFQEAVGIATLIGGSITLIGLILLVQKNK
jgi:drug/metabolite transporter (DMT)-like permease